MKAFFSTLFSAIVFLVFSFYQLSCVNGKLADKETNTTLSPKLPTKPNIIWIVAEDMSPYIAAFGDSTVSTPNLDWLASEGVCFDALFSTAGVCAPSRASLATGIYPTKMAANHMRTGPWFTSAVSPDAKEKIDRQIQAGANFYEALPAADVKIFGEILRKAGYYCTNNAKEDYQFNRPLTTWNENSNTASWKNRPKDKPFFAMYTLNVTHESQIWARAKDSLLVDKNLQVPVPPYLPNTPVALNDIRRMYSNIKLMDRQVGDLLKELKEAGELDNTVIFWFTDHGGPLPRQKRFLYDSGLKVPMIIRFPNKQFAQSRSKQLISFIDLPATALQLAGVEVPNWMDGKAFLSVPNLTPRKYIYAASDRFDESTDAIRAVRDERYKYIKYYKPALPMFLPVTYRDQMPIMQELYRLRDNGQLNEIQMQWFRKTKPEEELFDTWNDPHELNNIAGQAKYAAKLKELRQKCDEWVKETNDLNLLPEEEMMKIIWPEGKQPQTADPILKEENGKMSLSCATTGASIAYKYVNPGDNFEAKDWFIYEGPIAKQPGKLLMVQAHRIGYLPSEFKSFQ